MADVLVENHGTVATITPITAKARQWIKDNVEYEGWQVMGCSIALEPRCVEVLVEGMQDEGLVVE